MPLAPSEPTARVACAAILAGGTSTRMGRDKSLLLFEGQRLIERTVHALRPLFPHLVVVTGNPAIAAATALPAIPDQFAGRGPLGGIHAALEHFGAPTFVVACDMPFLSREFIAYLAARFEEITPKPDALVPQSADGIEPLHAIYSSACAPVFERLLRDAENQKAPSMRFALKAVRAEVLIPEVAQRFGVRFENWNTPEDIRASD